MAAKEMYPFDTRKNKVTTRSERRTVRRDALSTVLRTIWRSLVRIDRAQLTIATAMRSSFGIFLPLAIGVATGHIIEGVSLAGGAATVGSVGLAYTYRARTRTMLFACLAIAISAFVGGLIGPNTWLTILMIGLWGFGSGLLVSISPSATIIGLDATTALILLSHFNLSPINALAQAALMLSGALFQTALALIPSPWLHFGPESAAILAFSVLSVNYALFSLFITAETVMLLTFVDPQPAMVVLYRAIDTALGAAFALLAYALWPTWERSRVQENMAKRLESLQNYFVTVMDAFIDPARWNPDLITQRRLDARLARSNAEASVERALNEPVQYRGDPDVIHGLLVAIDSLAKGVLGLEAQLLEEKSHEPHPELETFKKEVSTALEKLSIAIRDADLFDVPKKLTLRSLEQSKKAAEARGEDVSDFNMLILQSGRIINSINVMNRLLSAHSGTTGPVSAVAIG